MKPCKICDETGWIDDPQKTWASEPGEHICPACQGYCVIDDDAPYEWDEPDWIEQRAWEEASEKMLDELLNAN